MTGSGDRKATAWCLVVLLLSNHALAVRQAMEVGENQFEAPDALEPDVQKAVAELGNAYQKGKAAEEKLTCEKIQEQMLLAVRRATSDIHPSCRNEVCHFPELEVDEADEIVVGQAVVSAYAAAADKRKCLPLVMGSAEILTELDNFLTIVPKVLHSSDREKGRSRMQEAYRQLVSFQQGTLALADAVADRKLLLTLDVKEQCPSPCKMCDHKNSGAFGFRCLLRKQDKNSELDVQESHGVKCTAPKRRSWGFIRRYPYAKQCEVADWQELALQQVHVSAMLSCATTTILAGLLGDVTATRRQELHGICVQMEQGNSVSQREQQAYERQMKTVDEYVSKGLKLTFGVFLVFGLASGLAALRLASHGNERIQEIALLEGAKAMTLPADFRPEDFLAPFAQHAVGEGLEVRPADRALYANSELVKRDEVHDRLSMCGDVYSLKEHNTFAEATKSLLMFSETMREGGTEVQVIGVIVGIVGGAISWAWWIATTLLSIVTTVAFIVVPTAIGVMATLLPVLLPALLAAGVAYYVSQMFSQQLDMSSDRMDMCLNQRKIDQ